MTRPPSEAVDLTHLIPICGNISLTSVSRSFFSRGPLFPTLAISSHPTDLLSCRMREKWIGQALRRAARCRRVALRQRCKAAIDIAATHAVGLQADRKARIIPLRLGR
jgi:hypothetical protein